MLIRYCHNGRMSADSRSIDQYVQAINRARRPGQERLRLVRDADGRIVSVVSETEQLSIAEARRRLDAVNARFDAALARVMPDGPPPTRMSHMLPASSPRW